VSATGQVADQARLLIVKSPMPKSTGATDRFFWRRRKVSNRTSGFPKTPRTVPAGTNPTNRYASRNARACNNLDIRQP
jgi:hypothetical protein